MQRTRKTLIASLLAVGLLHGFAAADEPADAPGAVRVFGALREIMHEGKTDAVVDLATLPWSDDLVAVGALSGLRGEITAVDGRIHLSYPRGSDAAETHEVESTDERAALLVLARVASWTELVIPGDVTLQELGEVVERLAAEARVDVERPFPFLVAGELASLSFHTIDGSRAPSGAHGPGQHAEMAIVEHRERTTGTLVGFYSRQHEGVLTHHGDRTHVHVVLREPLASGHVDAVTLRGGATVRLPRVFSRGD